jgi:ubiquinone/menaquinone biosynthesis C-methylase UbiE
MSRDVESPWRHVIAADYDRHMASPEVGQEPILDSIFEEVLRRYRPRSLAVPGCGTGSGFRHIDPAVTYRVVGVDINGGFLDALRQRHGARLSGLKLIAADLQTLDQPPGQFDLVHAVLVFEHVDQALVLPEWRNGSRPQEPSPSYCSCPA